MIDLDTLAESGHMFMSALYASINIHDGCLAFFFIVLAFMAHWESNERVLHHHASFVDVFIIEFFDTFDPFRQRGSFFWEENVHVFPLREKTA